jgi:hypothetical protein
MPPKRLCACGCQKLVCRTTSQNHLRGNAHMGLSSRILAQNAQLLQHSSNAPSLKRMIPFGAASSDQKKQKRADGAILLGSALDRTSMEADGVQPLLFSNNETTVPSSINGMLRRFTPITRTRFLSRRTFYLSFYFLSVWLLCRCPPHSIFILLHVSSFSPAVRSH